MAHLILAETTVSVSELKKKPMGTVAAGEGFPAPNKLKSKSR